MKRTKWLQETRMRRFEEAFGGWTDKRLTQEEAAELLGVCPRTFRRHVDRYHEEGLDGLIDKRMSQVSSRRAPADEVLRLEESRPPLKCVPTRPAVGSRAFTAWRLRCLSSSA